MTLTCAAAPCCGVASKFATYGSGRVGSTPFNANLYDSRAAATVSLAASLHSIFAADGPSTVNSAFDNASAVRRVFGVMPKLSEAVPLDSTRP